jgi:hypothetical protein
MLCPRGVGDTYLACSLADSILVARGTKQITVLAPKAHRFIAERFAAVRTFEEIPAWFNPAALKAHADTRIIYAHFRTEEGINLIGHNDVTLLDCYKALFNLPLETAPARPSPITEGETRTARHFFEDNALDPEVTVLLGPEAFSAPSLSGDFWRDLVQAIKQRGFQVFVNARVPPETLEGEPSGLLSLDLFAPAATLVAGTILLRSGLCDLLGGLKVPFTSLYPPIRWRAGRMIDGASLEKMGIGSTATELEVTDEAATIAAVVAAL